MMTETFDFATIKTLPFEKQKDYIKAFFIPLVSGDHIVLGRNKTYEIIDQATIKKVYFNRLNGDLNKFYFNEYDSIKHIVCELNKPRITDKTFNICPEIKAKYAPYKDVSKKGKKAVELFLKYIKEVLASDVEESYIYILKWVSNMLKGNKNDACIYLKGGQGIGKSTISDFLKDHVIGNDLFLETGSGPLKGKFNNILQGKLLVQFSELENFGMSEWSAISSILKRIITSTTYTIESKGKDSVQIQNVNNYILDSNNDAIKDDEGRRYYIADVSHKFQGDKDGYFSKLRATCFNDEVGSAFYSYMLEYNTEGFKPQEYPDTKSKLNSISKRLDSVYQFLKDEYVLTKQSVFRKPKDFYNEYLAYCNDKHISRVQDLIDFKSKLSQIGVDPVIATAARTNYYKIAFEDLNKVSTAKKWIHENDLEDIESVQSQPTINIPQSEYDRMLNQIKFLEEQLAKHTRKQEKKERNLMEEEDFDLIEEDEEEEAPIVKEGDESGDEEEEMDDEYKNAMNDALDMISML